MAKLSKEDILEFLKESTIIELNDLVKTIEEEFGISAAVPMAVAAGAPVAGGDAGGAAAEEPSEVSVILAGAGGQKINVIKVVRQITGLGLKEAKELVDGVPNPVKEGIPVDEANTIKAQLEEAGATVEIK